MNANANKTLVNKCGRGSLVRPLYFPGLLLEDEDLTTAVSYTQNSLRLVLRSLFGCGVVCGLAMEAKYICNQRKVQIIVHKGVGLDCEGNIIDVRQDETLEYDPGCETMPEKLWVSVCYTAKACMPANVSCSEEDDDKVVDRRSFDGYDIRVYKQMPECACSCIKPAPTPPKSDGPCCDAEVPESPQPATPIPAGVAQAQLRTGAAGSTLDPCDCYDKHNAGECECDCGGHCVVIGQLVYPGSNPLEPDLWDFKKDAQRFVRPMLLGAKDCYCKECRQQGRVPDPNSRYSPNAEYIPATGIVPFVNEARFRDYKLQLDSLRDLRYEHEMLQRKLDIDLITHQAALRKAVADFEAAQKAHASADVVHAAEAARRVAEARLENNKLELSQLNDKQKEIDTALKAAEARVTRADAYRKVNSLQRELAYIDEKVIVAKALEPNDQALTENRRRVVELLNGAFEELKQTP